MEYLDNDDEKGFYWIIFIIFIILIIVLGYFFVFKDDNKPKRITVEEEEDVEDISNYIGSWKIEQDDEYNTSYKIVIKEITDNVITFDINIRDNLFEDQSATIKKSNDKAEFKISGKYDVEGIISWKDNKLYLTITDSSDLDVIPIDFIRFDNKE